MNEMRLISCALNRAVSRGQGGQGLGQGVFSITLDSNTKAP